MVGADQVLSEFIGTYLLVLTVGCNVIDGSPVWAATSIASVLMVMIYSLGGVSGAHFNPAVTFAIRLSDKMDSWTTALIYMATQLVAGVLAGFSYLALYGTAFNLEPASGFGWAEVMVVEVAYTFMLCFVVLNVACAKANESNQYYGLAIGFVIVAGGYAAGGISGGAFNPAVAFGIDVPSAGVGFGWSFAYLAFELIGAALAALLFRIVRPEEFGGASFLGGGTAAGLPQKLVAEFIGTFFLVLTVGLNVLGDSRAAAWSIAASLMCMIYALGSVSGAHFNPAVTLAIILSGRGKCSLKEAISYAMTQILAGILAGVVYTNTMHSSFALGPGKGHGLAGCGMAEILYTFVLCFVVLCVATTKEPSADMFGFVIGSCVTVGGYAVGSISGGSLNPAVSFGIDVSNALKGGSFGNCVWYTAFEAVGAALAAGLFYVCRPTEYEKSASSNLLDSSYYSRRRSPNAERTFDYCT